jgi:hypothetical protein
MTQELIVSFDSALEGECPGVDLANPPATFVAKPGHFG